MSRILAIRGGAIGDFVLTLPALALLREAFPSAQLELVGYRHIVALVEGRGYATASRSIEYGPLSRFFSRDGELDSGLASYFAGFQQIISWLYDPDGIFAENMRRAGVRNFLHANPIVGDHDHAARQLARPLEKLALFLEDPAARLYPSKDDILAAESLLHSLEVDKPFLLVHPGSGSFRKCWPAEYWVELLRFLTAGFPGKVIVLAGESDDKPLATLQEAFRNLSRIVFATQLSLPLVAALAAQTSAFIGHDSGVSHIAAAAGAKSLLLFGPTDPDVWAPKNTGVSVLRAPNNNLEDLSIEEVCFAASLLTNR